MTGLDLGQLKRDIVAPVCQALALPGDLAARTAFMAGIASVESNAAELEQNGGPALGLWQMEPTTHDDCWQNFLLARHALGGVCLGYLPARFNGRPVGNAIAMVESLAYACALAAVRFYRSPIALPPFGDPAAMNAAWKAGYNTPSGAGAVDAARIALFQAAINA